MNRTNRIRIFYATTIVSACLCFYMGVQVANDYQERKQAKEEIVENQTEMENEMEEETGLPITNVDVPYEYVIVEEEGYLIVYRKDLETVYMYTDIRLEELDDSLQEEIRRGKPFSDLRKLYEFLENYSS